MSVNDLTNTIWQINEDYGTSEIGTKYINLVCLGNNTTYNSLSMYEDDGDYLLVYGDSSPRDVVAYYPDNWTDYNTYKTISITGGTDVTDATLIAWLENNAIQLQDLTGTSWRFNNNLDIADGSYNNTYYINFTDNENNSWTSMNIDAGSEEDEGDPEDPDDDTYNEWQDLTFGNQNNNDSRIVYDGSWQYYVDGNWDYTGCIITITGGQDTMDPALAQFLNANAVQQSAPAPAPSVDLKLYFGSSKIDKIAFMDNGTEKEVIKTDCIVPISFEDATWTQIKSACQDGSVGSRWSLGDTKTITCTDGNTYHIRLIDLQVGRYAYQSNSQPTHAVFELVELYSTTKPLISTGQTINTYDGLTINTFTLPEMLNQFTDIASILENVTFSCLTTINNTTPNYASVSNKLFLPSLWEFQESAVDRDWWNNETISPYDSQKRYGVFDYYKTHTTDTDRIKYKVDNNSALPYWARSIASGDPYWSVITNEGSLSQNYQAKRSGNPTKAGVSFIFAL